VIGSLRGRVLERSPDGEVLLEVGGVGYRVIVTPRALGELPPDVDAFLWIHHHLREDAQALYGFLARDERDCFEALLGAHGVGPALAMATLAVHTPEQLQAAVRAGDLDALCLVPGVGRKTAARLLLELKSRLDVLVTADLEHVVTSGNGHGESRPVLTDVREALLGLGYEPEEIRSVLRELPPDGDPASVLREALRQLGAVRA
jgi:Holliday junction DNA helicase RuvA